MPDNLEDSQEFKRLYGLEDMVPVAELLPEEFHDQVHPESLKVELPRSSFPDVKVEALGDEIHLFNLEKSHELIFYPIRDDPERPILRHNIFIEGPGAYSGACEDYFQDGAVSHGQFILD